MDKTQAVLATLELRDGALFWKRSGKQVKHCLDRTGYPRISVCAPENWRQRVTIRVHRIVWLLHYGAWPAQVVDHINRDKTDYRIENLRDVSQVDNMRNTSRGDVSIVGFDGTPGTSVFRVLEAGGKWRATIKIDGKRAHLGYFQTADEARAACKGASQVLRRIPLFARPARKLALAARCPKLLSPPAPSQLSRQLELSC